MNRCLARKTRLDKEKKDTQMVSHARTHTHARWRDETKPPPRLNVNGVCGEAGDGACSLRSHLVIQPAVFPERAVGT